MIFLLWVALFSNFSLATQDCPNIQGEYLCQYEEGTEPLRILQAPLNLEEALRIEDSVYILDGEDHKRPSRSGVQSDRYKAWCENGQIHIEERIRFVSNEVSTGQKVLTTRISLEGDRLKVESRGNMQAWDLPPQSIEDRFECKRQPSPI